MLAEIITIGDELLTGQITDTNSVFISGQLNALGIQTIRITSVPDTPAAISTALAGLLSETGIVIATGGLGPTPDDRTRNVLCRFFHTQLVENVEVLSQIMRLLDKKGLPLNESNKRQALVPQNCEILSNEIGTAPGMVFNHEKIFIFLPGVPFELVWMMQNRVIPFLQHKFSLPPVLHRIVLTSGAFEAQLSELLSDFENELPSGFSLAYLPSPGIIRLRLSCYSPGEKSPAIADRLINKLRNSIPAYFVTDAFNSMEEYCAHLLKSGNATVSAAESCTGGKIAGLLTSVAGSSAYFKGSVVAYDNELKLKILGVKEGTLQKHGAVSKQVVEEMAENGRRLMKTDYCIATSGIAGPDGGTPDKPVGTVWISISSAINTISKLFHFGDNRERNILRSSFAALNLLRKLVESESNA